MYFCVNIDCMEDVDPLRWQLGRFTCLVCGEKAAKAVKHCIVPFAKSNYQPITDLSLLKQLNKYATT